ncbi:unnamed protein product [Durusdinium trenchii]|uniref:Uncharacterized protein n=1 Tax=Durusdinium trenchii TaxID=1381693 RepID=A0ABP0Q2J4_9DINO
MELGTCEASLSVAMHETPNPDAEAERLNLSIPSWPQLSPKEQKAYTRSPAIHITTDDSDKILFTCLPGYAEGPLLDGNISTLCASHAAVRSSDLFEATSLFKNSFQTLVTEKNCPVLMDPSAPMDPIARNTAKGGMTMQQLSHILRLAYYATPFGDPHQEPFNYTGYDAAFADMVGFASLMQGGAPWGIKCPSRAVVASDQTTMPYCLQVDALSEKTFYAFSGSMSCPDGSAVSGWYNLPGIEVKAGALGGPRNATGLRLYCRSTPLLSSCEQPTTSYCQGGGVVVSVSFDSNQFKIGCCQLQRRLGMALTDGVRRTLPYQDFSGYYCPTGVDVTGAATYQETFIPSLGSPKA